MSQTKVFEFNYTKNVTKIVEGVEQIDKQKGTGEAEAIQFDSVADIIAYFEKQEEGRGETLLVGEVNASFKNTAIANKRAELTRVPAVPKAMAAKAQEKLDDTEKAQFNALMAKMGLKGLPA